MKFKCINKIMRKKRCCCDRLLTRALTRRSTDPGRNAIFQLLSAFSLIFRFIPQERRLSLKPPSTVYSPPLQSPLSKSRGEMARRIGVPRRYLDIVFSQGKVPYSVLFDHIRQGGVLRRDALIELRKRVPDASIAWLDDIQTSERWSELLRCYVPRNFDDDTDIKLLESALEWHGAQACQQTERIPLDAFDDKTQDFRADGLEKKDDPTKQRGVNP